MRYDPILLRRSIVLLLLPVILFLSVVIGLMALVG